MDDLLSFRKVSLHRKTTSIVGDLKADLITARIHKKFDMARLAVSHCIRNALADQLVEIMLHCGGYPDRLAAAG